MMNILSHISIKSLLYAIFISFTIINIVKAYEKKKRMKRRMRVIGNISQKDRLEFMSIICDIILYSSAIICTTIGKLIPLWIAVVIGLLLNCIVIFGCKKYNYQKYSSPPN